MALEGLNAAGDFKKDMIVILKRQSNVYFRYCRGILQTFSQID